MDRKAGGGDYEGHRAASVNKAAQGHWKEEKGLPQQTAAEAGKTAVTVKKRLQSENNGAALNFYSERLMIGQFFFVLYSFMNSTPRVFGPQ